MVLRLKATLVLTSRRDWIFCCYLASGDPEEPQPTVCPIDNPPRPRVIPAFQRAKFGYISKNLEKTNESITYALPGRAAASRHCLSPATVLIVKGVHAAFNSSVCVPAVSEGRAWMQ
jgi:hypothetical protein